MTKKQSQQVQSLLPDLPMITLHLTQSEITVILEILRFAGAAAAGAVKDRLLNNKQPLNSEEIVQFQKVFKFSNELQSIIAQSVGIGEPRDGEIH